MKNFFKGAGILAVCAMIAKIIGALYRIPLTNVLGAEGIGLYQMVFPLYTVLLTVSSGGLPVAISKAVAAKGQAHARKIVRYALISLTLAGSVAMLIVASLHRVLATAQGTPDAALAYLGIAPSLLFVAVISCFRGYFQGLSNMLPTALSQLLEQAVKLVLGLFFAKALMPYGLAMGVLGSVIGVTLSEFVAMVGLGIQYLIVRKKNERQAVVPFPVCHLTDLEAAAELTPLISDATMAGANQSLSVAGSAIKARFSARNRVGKPNIGRKRTFSSAKSPDRHLNPSTQKNAVRAERKSILGEIYRVAIPVTLGSLVLPLTQVFDSMLVVNILSRTGTTLAGATALYGLVTGPVNSLINMPTVITLALSGALLPKISRLFSRGESLGKTCAQAMRIAVCAGIVFFVGLMLFAGMAMRILYASGLSATERSLASALLRIGSISVLYVSILQVATAVLQGTDRAHIPAVNLLIGAAVKAVLTAALLPIMGITGAVTATVACYGVTCLLDVVALFRVRKNKSLLPRR